MTAPSQRGLSTPKRFLGRFLLWGGFLLIAFSLALLGRLLIANGNTRLLQSPRLGQEEPITPMDLRLEAANNSPMLAEDPTNPRFLALANRLDAPGFSCALYVSGDAGNSWRAVQVFNKLPRGADRCYAPEVGFDRQGRLYYLFVGLHGPGNEPMGAFLASSDDYAQTFTAPRKVLGPLNFGIRMGIDPSQGDRGRIHLVWLHATSDPPLGGYGPPPNPIMTAYSDNGGRNFSDPVQVNSMRRQHVIAPALALAGDGRVHTAFYDLRDDVRDYFGLEGPKWEGEWSLVTVSSSDGGRSFGRETVITDAIIPPGRPLLIFTFPPPALAADRKSRICSAWADSGNGDPDSMLSCSRNRGQTWGSPVRLNDDAMRNGKDQLLPQIAISDSGRIDAVFYDRRRDTHNYHNDVRYTFSIDGGRRFSRNLKINSDPSNSRIGQQYTNVSAQGQFEFGTRLGLLSRENDALAVWTDTRNSRVGTTSQDLFGIKVTVSVDEGPHSGRYVAYFLLILGGLATVIGLGAVLRAVLYVPSS